MQSSIFFKQSQKFIHNFHNKLIFLDNNRINMIDLLKKTTINYNQMNEFGKKNINGSFVHVQFPH